MQRLFEQPLFPEYLHLAQKYLFFSNIGFVGKILLLKELALPKVGIFCENICTKKSKKGPQPH